MQCHMKVLKCELGIHYSSRLLRQAESKRKSISKFGTRTSNMEQKISMNDDEEEEAAKANEAKTRPVHSPLLPSFSRSTISTLSVPPPTSSLAPADTCRRYYSIQPEIRVHGWYRYTRWKKLRCQGESDFHTQISLTKAKGLQIDPVVDEGEQRCMSGGSGRNMPFPFPTSQGNGV